MFVCVFVRARPRTRARVYEHVGERVVSVCVWGGWLCVCVCVCVSAGGCVCGRCVCRALYVVVRVQFVVVWDPRRCAWWWCGFLVCAFVSVPFVSACAWRPLCCCVVCDAVPCSVCLCF